jgi:hypothetical protein
MRNPIHKIFSVRSFLRLIFIFLGVILPSVDLFSQEEPPVPIEVSDIRDISFGSFVQLGGIGTVALTYDGIRTGSNVSFLGSGYVSGRFSILGTIYTPVTIILDANPITLSDGGTGTISLNIDSWSIPLFPNYVLPTSSKSDIFFGGTLSVPPGSPPGTYTGNLLFTFIQNNE